MKTNVFLPVVCFGSTIFLVATAHAYDPYQSRLDREYQSYSNALSRAYAVPAPAYTPPPSYSSSSSYSSPSPTSTYKPSYGGYSNSYEPPAKQPSPAELQKAWKALQEGRERERKLNEIKEAAMWDRIRRADARAAHERWLDAQVETPAEWEKTRLRTKGRAPLRAPTNRALETPSSEFAFYSAFSNDPKGQWESLRAGQIALNNEAPEANPSDAFAYFSKSNPEWVEVQFGLGVCYLSGLGVEADPQKARELLVKVAGYQQEEALKMVWTGGGGLPPDYAYQACRELAYAYDFGRGLPADSARALQWYESAYNRPLFERDLQQMVALIADFWKRNEPQRRALIEAEFASSRPDEAARNFDGADAKTLYEIGEFVDSKPVVGGNALLGRSAATYFFEAAKQGYEPAARAYFSPAKNGVNVFDLSRSSLNSELYAEQSAWISANWPLWEAKWKAASANGDAGANLPLAFYYSGARGNESDLKQATFYFDKLPADTPEIQKAAIKAAFDYRDSKKDGDWFTSVLKRFNAEAADSRLDFTVLPGARDLVEGEKLRESGNALAATDPETARENWRDAAALGDLPAAMQTYAQIRASRFNLNVASLKTLRDALETQARAGDQGAILALQVALGGNRQDAFHFDKPHDVDKDAWREQFFYWDEQLKPLTAKKVAFEAIAADPNTSDADYQAARSAAQTESEALLNQARQWGLQNDTTTYNSVFSPARFEGFDAQRRAWGAVREHIGLLETQLSTLGKSLAPKAYNPDSDISFVEGIRAWFPRGNDPKPDYPGALDAFSHSSAQGHPLAPLAIAFFYGSGVGGFPVNPALAQRWRALADARLETLAQSGEGWAQMFLGSLLVENLGRSDDARQAINFEWLPLDKERGLKWLQIAALNNNFLPHNFGDSQGQSVALYLSQRYAEWDDEPASEKWERIDNLVNELRNRDQETTPVAATAMKVEAQKILDGKL